MNYRGISFPFRFENGGIATTEASSTQTKHIVEAIKQIVLTNPNERVMLADFGCNIRRFLFESDNLFDSLVKRLIEDQLLKWEDRVEIKEIVINKKNEGVFINISFINPQLVEEETEVFYGYLSATPPYKNGSL